MISEKILLKFWNFWPPFLGAGIKIQEIKPDFSYLRVRLKFTFWNKNIIRTQYGGSMFSMTDPFYMVMLGYRLGKDYRAIDKAAGIQFLKKGLTALTAEFSLTDADISDIKVRLEVIEKFDWERTIDIFDEDKNVVARVTKVIQIKLNKKPVN